MRKTYLENNEDLIVFSPYAGWYQGHHSEYTANILEQLEQRAINYLCYCGNNFPNFCKNSKMRTRTQQMIVIYTESI